MKTSGGLKIRLNSELVRRVPLLVRRIPRLQIPRLVRTIILKAGIIDSNHLFVSILITEFFAGLGQMVKLVTDHDFRCIGPGLLSNSFLTFFAFRKNYVFFRKVNDSIPIPKKSETNCVSEQTDLLWANSDLSARIQTCTSRTALACSGTAGSNSVILLHPHSQIASSRP